MRWLGLALVLGCGRFGFDSHDAAPVDATPVSCPSDASPGVVGAERFVAASGGDDSNPGTAGAPWATFAYAFTALAADETLVLGDGVYTQQLYVTRGGMRIRAATDGGAVIDGQGVTIPCRIDTNDVTLEGVRCRSGNPYAVRVQDANRVTLRRITAHDAQSEVFRVARSNDVVLEDVAAWGTGVDMFQISTSNRVTVRRCWARWTASSAGYNAVVMVLDSNDSLIENCIATAEPPMVNVDVVGFQLYAPGVVAADRNRYFGNVAYDLSNWSATVSSLTTRITGNRFVDTVLVSGGGGLYQRADADFGIERLTAVGFTGAGAFVVDAHSMEPKNPDFAIGGFVRDSVLGVASEGFYLAEPVYLTSFMHSNNTLFGLTQPYRGPLTADPTETNVDPGYDTATYGRGAYLIRSSLGTGAEVLRRYQDGTLTDISLWPWPMEDRILRESGHSVTWESGGGLWRALPGLVPPCP